MIDESLSNVPTHRGRVLVIDDEPAIARSIQRILQGANDVVLARDAADALTRVRGGERFDLLLCDLQMPGMSGMQLHEELDRVCPEQADRMLFMTGGALPPEARAFVDCHVGALIEKPFAAADLRERVRARLS